MSKVFIIPDVHLKPWMFEKASDLIDNGSYDAIVMMGDLVDDWYQGRNIDLYNETFDAAITFVKKYPNTFLCYGNHDMSYLWEAMESGYSLYARETVVNRINELNNTIPEENRGYVLKIDNVLFSRGGLTESFIMRHFYNGKADLDTMIAKINSMGKEVLWQDDSPIWARPQYGSMRMYPNDLLQVVGHTPVKTVLEEGNLLTVDNFSTYSDGRPIGDERFVLVDTINKTWIVAE